MVNSKCFVPNCTSGYKSNPTKVSFFSAANENRLKLWQPVIPRADKIFRLKDRICEKHFSSSDIIRTWTSTNGLMTGPLQRPRLVETAIPSIFPDCSKHLAKMTGVKRKSLDTSDLPSKIIKQEIIEPVPVEFAAVEANALSVCESSLTWTDVDPLADTTPTSPKKVNDSSKPKRKVVKATIELKKEIIAKYDRGVRVSDLAVEYGMPRSTISTFLKHKEVIKRADVAKGVKVLTKQRSQTIEEVEKLLLIWINEKQAAGDRVSEAIICEKARMLHADLLKDAPGRSVVSESFKASKGWCEKFKKRSGINTLVRHGEVASADKMAAEEFVKEFEEHIEAKGFIPQQVFNWKQLRPEPVAARDLEGVKDEPLPYVVEDIVNLSKSIGMKVSVGDVEDHKNDLNTEEFEDHQRVAEEFGKEFREDVEANGFIPQQVFNWKQLRLEPVAARDFEGLKDGPLPYVVEDIKSMGLEVSDYDMEDHKNDCSTEELQDLQRDQHQTAAEGMSSEEEGGREDIPSSLIKKMIQKWGELESFVEKYHPNKEEANRVINLFNNNAMAHFQQVLKRRQKQTH